MTRILTLLFFLFCKGLAANELETVTPEQLLKMQQTQNALVVDIRTEAEWQASGIISNSHKLQSFDTVILVCRSGNRSGKSANS